jgi:hypothetical protein
MMNLPPEVRAQMIRKNKRLAEKRWNTAWPECRDICPVWLAWGETECRRICLHKFKEEAAQWKQ